MTCQRLDSTWPATVFHVVAFALCLSSPRVTDAWQTPPTSDAADSDIRRVLEQAERVLKSDSASSKYRVEDDELIRGAARTRDTLARTELLHEIVDQFQKRGEFSDARKAALAVNPSHREERVRGLLLVSRGELAAGNPEQAWWTLHEAQQTALKIEDELTVVSVFREIAKVERRLRAAAKNEAKSLTPLNPTTDDVISTVLRDGLPERGYREIEIVRPGGGPSREPTVIQHPFFYNGDRFFQGPSLRGGPTVVQVTHPRTNCQVEVEFNMPTGAPIVEYRERSIEYYFPEMVIRLEFKRSGNVEVDYHKLGNKFRWLRWRISTRNSSRPVPAPIKSATRLVRETTSRGLAFPRGIAERLPVFSDLVETQADRISGSLKTPGTR